MPPHPRTLTVRVASPLALALLLGCNSGQGDPANEAASPSAESPSSDADARPQATPPASDATPAGPIVVSKAVPADAAAVVIMRAPERLFDTAALLGWVGGSDPASDEALRAEIDGFLRERIGVELTSARSVTVFYAASPERFGVIIDGVEGETRGPEHKRHGDTILRTLEGDVLVASRDSQMLLGNEAGIVQMLDALDGKLPALVDDSQALASLLASESAGASVVVVAEAARLPPDVAETAAQIGVERAYFGIGSQGLRVVASGSPEDMLAAAKMVEQGLAQAQEQLANEKTKAMAGDDVFMGVAGIVAGHTGARLSTLLQPKVDGGRLVIDVPVNLGNHAAVVTVLGVGAAIAVPALQKYMRRAKTAEPKVRLARLFDATAMYFKEERVIAGQAQHLCPNDGRLTGEAGITPPLSVNCNDGPGGRCIPSTGAKEAGHYDVALWRDNPVWEALGFEQEQAHYFHYNFKWANTGEGYGACAFTVQAFADLDDDGVFSTFERSGTADAEGVNAAVGLYIDRELD